MSESEQYMTGEELYRKWMRLGRWNAFAAEQKIPHSPNPKSPGQVLCEYHDFAWDIQNEYSQQSWELAASKLLTALNAAQAALDSKG